MAKRPPLLVISHTFPPYRGIGGRRWAKFARMLAARGRTVHVIHSAGSDALKGSLWTDDVAQPGIITHPLPQRYPTVLFKRPITSVADKVAYRFWSHALPRVVQGNWYDKTVLWKAQLLRTCGRLIHAHGIRDVVATGAPFRQLHHLLELPHRYPGVRLLADFRDTWAWGDAYGFAALSPERQDHERRLEREVVLGYHRVISPSEPILAHLKATYGGPGERYVLLPHAYDPDELGDPVAPPNDGRFRMIYAGSLYGAAEADAYFDSLLQALRTTRERHPEAFARCQLDLYITGHGTDTLARKVEQAALQDTITFHPPTPPRVLFPRIAMADLVVVFIPTINRDLMGTKFNELFHLRRPILHVGAEGGVSRTITHRRLGLSVRVEELPTVLTDLIAGIRTITIDTTADLRANRLDTVTDQLERLLDEPAPRLDA